MGWEDSFAGLILPVAIGAATNQLVAKIAKAVGKRQAVHRPPPNPVDAPMAITVVPPGTEATFLAPLLVQVLWGVGPKTAGTLAALGIQTIGDLARQVTLDNPTTEDQVILTAAQALLTQAWRGQPVRLIGVGVTGLTPPAAQLSLWEAPDTKGQRLQQALDNLRERYGTAVVRRASEVEL